MYVSTIFTSTPEEFEALYGAFDAVMTKYRIIVSVLKEIRIRLFQETYSPRIGEPISIIKIPTSTTVQIFRVATAIEHRADFPCYRI